MLYWAKEYQGRNDRMKRFFLMLCAAMVLMLPAAGALANHGAMNGQAAVYMGPSRSAYGQFAGGIDQSATIYIHTYVVDDQGGLWYHIMFDLDDGEIYGGYVEAGAVTAYGSETNEERFWGEDAQMLTDVEEVLLAPVDGSVSVGSVRNGQSVSLVGFCDGYAIIEVPGERWRGYVPEDTVITVQEIEMGYTDD